MVWEVSSLRQLCQRLLRRRMIRMLCQQFQEHLPSFVRLTLDSVYPRQVQIRLIKGRSDADALFENCNRLVPPTRAQVKYAKIVQGLRVRGTKLQCFL